MRFALQRRVRASNGQRATGNRLGTLPLAQRKLAAPPYEGGYYVYPHWDHYPDGWHMHEGYWAHEDHDNHYWDNRQGNRRDDHRDDRRNPR